MLKLKQLKEKQLLTSLCAGVEESTRGLHSHGSYGAIQNLRR